MISIARKNLLSEKPKFIAGIVGVAFSIMVILAPVGIYFGTIAPLRALPLNAGGDLWVIQEGSSDLVYTRSILVSGYEDQLDNVDGVISASSIISYSIRVEVGGELLTTYLVGFDKDTGAASPWKMFSGKSPSSLSKSEVILDRSLASTRNVDIGDNIYIDDEPFRVAGLSLDSNILIFQYIFMNKDDARTLLDQDQFVNYYILDIEDGKGERIKQAVEDIVPNSSVESKEYMADANEEIIRTSFLPIISLLAFIGLLVGITIIGITVYTATADKAKEYAVLKAVGIKSSKLYKIVLQQSLISSIAGYILGVVFYYLVTKIAFYIVPAVNFDLDLEYYAYVFIAALVMSIISSVIPARKINSIDPALVFKS